MLTPPERAALLGIMEAAAEFLTRNVESEADYWERIRSEKGAEYLRRCAELGAAAKMRWAASVLAGTIPRPEDATDPEGDATREALQIRVDDLESINEVLRQELEELESTVDGLEDEKAQALEELEELEATVEDKRAQIHRLQGKVSTKQTRGDRWKAKCKSARQELENLAAALEHDRGRELAELQREISDLRLEVADLTDRADCLHEVTDRVEALEADQEDLDLEDFNDGGPAYMASVDAALELLEDWERRGQRVEALEASLDAVLQEARTLCDTVARWAAGQDRRDTLRKLRQRLELAAQPEVA